jgi:NAD(P)H dehydrogenase (quinone)
MSILSIVYFSGSGHTAKLAEAVAVGASSVEGTTVHLLLIAGEDIQHGRYNNEEVFSKLDASDAIIFGSPTYMGGPAAQFKAFADATGGRWYGSAWKNKLASGFSISNSPSGDKFSTLQYFQTLAMQHGMIWIGLGEMPMQPNGVNRLGSFSGATAQAGQEPADVAPNAEDKLTGEILGKRVAEFTSKLTR